MKLHSLIAVAASAVAVGSATLIAATPADAARMVRVCESNSGRYVCRYRRYDPSDEATRIRARNLDPAGDYAGYPAWAQFALSPKLDNGRKR